MKKTLLLALVYSLFSMVSSAHNRLPDRYDSYIVDAVYASDDKAYLQNNSKSELVKGLDGHMARITRRGGGFTYRMAVADTVPQLLVVRYSGNNAPRKGEKLLFNISVNGTILYTEGLNRNRHGLFEVVYSIPPSLLKGQKSALVRFASYDKTTSVGEIYAAAIVRQKSETGLFGDRENWQGLDNNWMCSSDGILIYTEPDGPENPYTDNSVIDLMSHYALELSFKHTDAESIPVEVFVSSNKLNAGTELKENSTFSTRKAEFTLNTATDGSSQLLVTFSVFDSPKASQSTMRKIKSIAIRLGGKSAGNVKLLSARLLDGNSVKVDAERFSKSGESGETIVYPMSVTNCETESQTVHLSIQKYGWEAFPVEVNPARLQLAPGETRQVEVSVLIPPGIPAGGREKQTLRILPSANPSAAQTVTFTTLRTMPRPLTIHTAEGWKAVREKAAKYDWAKERKERYIRDAEQWIVPARPAYMLSEDGIPCICATTQEHGLMNAAIAWQLTGNREYARKAKQFLLMISDYKTGFPLTRKASNQASVQEGHFFQHLAQAYDLILDAGVLTEDECKQIEHTFRLYIDLFLRYKSPGGANWAVSQLTGVFFCALAMQDFNLVDEVLYAPSCLIDKFRTYTMPDGWWYECTVSYNLWVASEYIQIGLALEPFGYSLLTEKFPVDYNLTPEYDKMGTNERADQRNLHHGHSFRIRGPIHQPYVTIKMMSDALVPFLDYRGWIFGINDATEREVGGDSFEMAYYAFRDPRYAAFIRKAPKRNDLIYGVPELPETIPNEVRGAYADNAGALMLRSTQKEPREKIQAVLKYGTHGGYHGHFDRTAMLSLMRYGRSFYNPEMVWYSYAPYMYNFYVQTSISKNMVTVDLKQQEADESKRSLFHTGDLFQAGCVEGTAAWSYPAYGGLRSSMKGPRSFEEKTEWEARYFPTPKKHPDFGVLTGFTEPIFQRRLMVVTDDYVALADYDKSTTDEQHRFDLLFQVKGLLGIAADTKEYICHKAQLDTDSLSAAPLVTDVNHYSVTGTLKASFLTKFGPGADNRGTRIYGEPGNLYMDIYNAWPNACRTAFTGRAPEEHGTQRMLEYAVQGDGKTLANGKFGAWILGEGRVDVDVIGIKKLTLSSAIPSRGEPKTLFWAEAVLETHDGKLIPLSELPVSKTNVLPNPYSNTKDYADGRINISGQDYRWGLPAEPVNPGSDSPALYTFDLTGLDAVRFKTVVGGDYPLGDEAERRITFGVRTDAPQARFLTVIEPFEKESVVESVIAPSADELIVKLKDGREHRIFFSGMEGEEGKLAVKVEEWKEGMLVREERTR